MTQSKAHSAGKPPSAHLSPSAGQSTAPDQEAGNADISRRSFLYSLGALALSACGGSGGSGGDAPETGIQTQATRLRASVSGSGLAHPGLLHTQADFDRMALKVNSAPWSASWSLLISNSHAKLTYTPAPVAIVYRGYDGVHPENYARLFNDIAAAYACALRWKISGDTAYADKSVQIMNAWSTTLTAISGTSDQSLAAGIYGYEFANAGEIMRNYPGWAGADFARFQAMMRNIFYPLNHDFLVNHRNTPISHYWSNWDLCNMASVMAIGVLCDDQVLFDEAVTYFKSGAGNGCIWQMVYYVHPGYLGQAQESGRDQGHNTLSISLMGALCEMAWNQGLDLYGYGNNRFLMAAEYVAKGNLIESGTSYYTVPFVPYNNVDKVNQTVFSTVGQGTIRPCWALLYHHYVNRKGLAAPYSRKFALLIQPEGGGGNYGPNSGGYDQLGYGTLTCTLDPIADGAPPSGLSAFVSDGQVTLSWWGSAYATGYTVKRALVAGGPYTTVASGITDLLTYTDSGLADGSYYYVVSAATPAGESAASNEAKATLGVALLAHLKFDDAIGSSAADASGNGRSGTLAGATSWVTGKRAGAVALDGVSGHVSLPPGILGDVSDFTISTWMYWNAARTWERLFDFGSGTGQYMMLTARAFSGLARFAISVDGVDGELFVQSNAALPRSAWSHVVVTLKGKVCTMYVNGVVVGAHTNMFLAPFRLQNTDRSWIGRSQFAAHPYFNGKIDDFRIYRGALGADDVIAMMNEQAKYVDMAANVKLTQQGATYNRITQKYVGAVTLTNIGPALSGRCQLRLEGLTTGLTLDNASGTDAGVPYVNVDLTLAPGATLNVPLTFTNPARSLVSYTPKLVKNAY